MANIREAIALYLEPAEDDLISKQGSQIRKLVV